MLNYIVKVITGKEIIFYNPHRNINPLLNKENREKYIFFNPIYIRKASAIFGRNSKLRFRFLAFIYTVINPVYIIRMNWREKMDTFHLVWCNKHKRNFIVVQHGIYHGGIVRDIKEKYVKCNIFLVWGHHFKQLYEENNRGKQFKCIPFGNPVYNSYNRGGFSYKKKIGNRVLIAVSVIEGERLKKLHEFLEILEEAGFDINVKPHNLQSKKTDFLKKYRKTSRNLYELLINQEFDILVTDVSSAMTDIIFFKNRVIYFSPDLAGSEINKNVYSKFLKNAVESMHRIHTREDILGLIDLKAQENLLKYLIVTDNTDNRLDRLNCYFKKR